jgi:hypothetical protein
MAQEPLSQVAVACMNGLPEGWTIYRREDGAVIIRQPGIKTPHPRNESIMVGPDYSECRVDSDKDRDRRLKGGTVWYDALLKAAEKAAKKPAPKGEAE